MINKKIIIVTVLVLVGLGLFIIGYSMGISVSKPELQKTANMEKILNSKSITMVGSFGKVSKISGRTITLEYNGETFDVTIKSDAIIYLYGTSASGSGATVGVPSQTAATFNDIKIGDSVNVTIKLSADGQVEGSSVTIVK